MFFMTQLLNIDTSDIRNGAPVAWGPRRALALAIMGACSFPVLAQDSYVLEEIVVTAQKRAESVQDVPIAISAMSGNFIQNVGAQDVNDLGIYTPGLETRVTQATQPRFSIRGIATTDFGIGADPAVAVYVDGVYSGRSGASLTAFQDIERVEVLKGPQGTLFGKNAAAGAIHLISKKPSDEFESTLGMNVGNYNKQKFEAMVNVPISDDLALRINVMDNSRDGYRENRFNGQKLSDENNGGARASLLWKATEDTQVLAQLDYSNLDQNAAVDSSLLFGDAYGDTQLDVTPHETLDLWGASVTVETDLDKVLLTSITAIKRFESNNLRDEDGTDLFTATGGLVPLFFSTENVEQNTFFSQELRLTSQSEDEMRWSLGMMYSREHGQQDTRTVLSTDIINAFIGPFLPSGQLFPEQASGDLISTSAAIYADMTYSLSDELSVTAGLRYTRDQKDYELTSLYNVYGFGILFPVATDALEMDDSWSNLSSRVVLDYAFAEDAMVYLSYATGYKAGGFNSTQVALPFDEEQVSNLELGLKSSWLDSHLRFNASLYSYVYEDLQDYAEIPDANTGITQLIIRNQDAEGQGLELDLIWAATEHLTLSANYNYLDTEVTDFQLLGAETEADDRTGKALTNVAEQTYNLGAEYVVTLGAAGELAFRVDYSYVGDREFPRLYSADPVAQALADQNIDQLEGAYDNINARITYRDSSGHWQASLWGQNLTDEEYLYGLSEGSTTIGSPSGIRANPRFYGLDVSYQF